LNND
jgi:diadenosine tetraphosphate (Ap4A) HIT family hydrolase